MTEENYNELADPFLPTPKKKEKDRVQVFLEDLKKEIKSTDEELNKAEAIARLEELYSEYTGEDALVSFAEIAERLKNQPPEKKILTGYPAFDAIMGGFRAKQLVVVSAATKSGKTSWCVDLTLKMASENPLWLPFEESAEELVQKFIDRNEPPPHAFTPQRISGNTILWVEKKIIESKAKYNSSVVFIDHLHFIVDLGENMSLQIGRTMRELKRIAKQWNVTIFLIAHLKKTKMEEQPDLEDLRDSSFIAQEADTVIMLWRKTTKQAGRVVIENEVNVSVQANRRTGKTGNVTFMFEDGKFREIGNANEEEEIAERKLNSW